MLHKLSLGHTRVVWFPLGLFFIFSIYFDCFILSQHICLQLQFTFVLDKRGVLRLSFCSVHAQRSHHTCTTFVSRMHRTGSSGKTVCFKNKTKFKKKSKHAISLNSARKPENTRINAVNVEVVTWYTSASPQQPMLTVCVTTHFDPATNLPQNNKALRYSICLKAQPVITLESKAVWQKRKSVATVQQTGVNKEHCLLLTQAWWVTAVWWQFT